jgi:hypothetical protein
MMNVGKISSKIALCGILTALSVISMMIAGLLGVLTYAAPMIAGGVMIIPQRQYGKGTAFTMFAAVSLLGMILIPDREMALIYLFLFGHYPILQPLLNGIVRKPLRILLKAAVFNAGALLTVLLAKLLFAIPILDAENYLWLLAAGYLAAANICFFLYDRALMGFYAIYDARFSRIMDKYFR